MKRREFCAILAGTLAAGSLPGCKGIRPMGEWIVKIATQTGEFIEEHAKNLYEAVHNAFFRWQTEDGVKFDRENPLQGICTEERDLLIRRDDSGYMLMISMKGRRLCRKSEIDPWVIDRDELPEDLKILYGAGTSKT